MLPIEPIVQYGLLGIFTYLVLWGTLKGYPRLMESHDNQINKSAELVTHVMDECTEERTQTATRFERLTTETAVRFERLAEADRLARHAATNQFQKIITEFVLELKVGMPRHKPET